VFDFLESDWFNISLQVIFVLLVYYDIKKWHATKKKEHIFNIILTIGFGIWALYPYYTSYVGWEESEKKEMLSYCKGDANKTKLCQCLDDATFKNYTYAEYKALDKNSSEYKEFLQDAKEDCEDDSWF